ncbi:MAG: RNA 2'-phosphotransferase [Candidatus Latescibacterota bacterium]
MSNQRKISRLLSLMLRHRPDEFGLTIDTCGFVPLAQAVQAVKERYEEVEEADVMALIRSPDQHRFEVTERGIRALYGHSFFVEMDGPPMTPPETLYIGATAAVARRYREEGITPGDRFYVHLSRSRAAAEERSREEAGPVVVEVQALKASQAGIEFYERGEVILTRHVPPQFVGQTHGAAAPTQAGSADGPFWRPPPRTQVTYGRKLRKDTRR